MIGWSSLPRPALIFIGVIFAFVVVAASWAFLRNRESSGVAELGIAEQGTSAAADVDVTTFSGQLVSIDDQTIMVRDAGGELTFTLNDSTQVRRASNPEQATDQREVKPDMVVAVEFESRQVEPPILAKSITIIDEERVVDPCQKDESADGCPPAPTLSEFTDKVSDEQRRCVERGMGSRYQSLQAVSMHQIPSELLSTISVCFPPLEAPPGEAQ